MIVAITGGTGFIGQKLVLRHIALGDEVRVLSRRSPGASGLPGSVVWCCDDLVIPANLLSFVEGVDVLYHCAAENNDSSKMLAANAEGTGNLARAAEGKIKHWVQLSSVGVYGTHTDGMITEETPIAPVNVYEESKAAAENVVIETAVKGGFSYTILRPSKVYGLGMNNKILFQLISLIDRGIFFFVGKPGASANYIHVDNVVDALVKCGSMPAARNHIYNISDYRTMEDFVAIISRALHKPVPSLRISESWARLIARMTVFIPNNPLTEQRVNAMVKRAIYSPAKLEAELGYRPRVSMEDGLRDLVGFWKRNASQD